MFALDQYNGKITNLNLRAEKHGDENQPACDIKVSVDLPSVRLDEISPGLCESLFRKPGPGDQLPLVEVGKRPDPGFTALRHPGLEPVKVKQKFPGYELTVAADEENEGQFFADAEVKNFAIEAREGGTATVTFSVGVQVDEDDIAALLPFLRTPDAVLKLVPPKAQAEQLPEAA